MCFVGGGRDGLFYRTRPRATPGLSRARACPSISLVGNVNIPTPTPTPRFSAARRRRQTVNIIAGPANNKNATLVRVRYYRRLLQRLKTRTRAVCYL